MLRDYVRPELVSLELRAEGVAGAIHALVARLHELGLPAEPAEVEAALMAREEVHTTALGGGVAVPHATLEGLEQPILAVAIAPEGVAYGPVGLEPVHVFFLLISPMNQSRLHIKLLARIARLVRHPGLIATLRRCESAPELLAALERIDAEHV
jgi:mannitol/fructose-specific phosphotransferase system IIA component (Ntr-type)